MSEGDIVTSWARANVAAGRNPAERDYRLSYILWRVWWLRRKKAEVEMEEAARSAAATDLEPELGSVSELENMGEVWDELSSPRESSSGDKSPPVSPGTSTPLSRRFSGTRLPALPEVELDVTRGVPLHFVLISLHGLVRGTEMELGRDADTGGQVKYVVELAQALAKHPGVHRVDLLTRMVTDPIVDSSYGVPEECLSAPEAPEDGSGAYIIRLPAGDPAVYLRKELLWPHLREFADHALEYIRCHPAGRLICMHGHYADAAEISTMIGATLGCSVLVTGHSLGKNKLDDILRAGKMTRAQVESQYRIGRRIEAEERALDHAEVMFVSTEEEITKQWGLYAGFDVTLERALTRSRRFSGRAMPRMVVIPPGLDFSQVRAFEPEAPLPVGEEEPPIWREIARFLRNPRKPAILALARPDAKKNLTTLVRAFGENALLRELANLVIFAGNRDAIDAMPTSARLVMESIIKLTDSLDLYGSIALPKHHKQEEKSDIYSFAASTRGVFVNCALSEPFGLVLIEAAAHGVPTVATKHGGPSEIHSVLENGLLVEPTDSGALADALVALLTDRGLWQQCRDNGIQRIGLYSWEAHCRRYLAVLDDLERRSSRRRRRSSSANVAAAAVASPPIEALHAPPPMSLVCVLLDSRDAQKGAALLQRAIDVVVSSGSGAAVVVLSVLTVEDTLRTIEKAGVLQGSCHAVVADCGAVVLQHTARRQDLVSSEEWSELISFRWLRAVAVRAVLSAAAGSLVLAPTSVGAAASAHILRFSLAPSETAVPAIHVLMRRLRRQGVRVHMSYAAGAWELRVLPLRASRALALRWLAQRWGVPLQNVLVVAAQHDEPDGDRAEVLSGALRVVLVGGSPPATPRAVSRAETGGAESLTADDLAIAAAHVNRTTHLDDEQELAGALLLAFDKCGSNKCDVAEE